MNPRVLIKLGGAALTDPQTRDAVVSTIHQFRKHACQVAVVHGGGPHINNELRRRGLAWTFVDGQRVTTAEMMGAIESTLCGEVNRGLVRHFGAHGLPAVGLAGTDNRTLLCTPFSPELGLVGRIEQVNAAWIGVLMDNGLLPIIAPLGVDANGQAFNINADWAASHLSTHLHASEMLFLTDQPGILDEEGKVIPFVDLAGLHNMIEARMISGGMLTKVMAIIHALKNGVRRVRVMNSQTASEDVPFGSLGTTCRTTADDSRVVSVETQHVVF